MPRPFKARRIYGDYVADVFKPRGKRMGEIEEIFLEADELEALRLADLDQLYQNDAAEKMGVSRQTFGTIIKRAHQKVADAIINGKAIRITPRIVERRRCHRCGRGWAETEINLKKEQCPECESDEVETVSPTLSRGSNQNEG